MDKKVRNQKKRPRSQLKSFQNNNNNKENNDTMNLKKCIISLNKTTKNKKVVSS